MFSWLELFDVRTMLEYKLESDEMFLSWSSSTQTFKPVETKVESQCLCSYEMFVEVKRNL